MAKQWRQLWSEDCDACGGDVEIFTEASDHGYDGDPVRCTECKLESAYIVDEDGGGWINWDPID